jgi:hypothetical protein
MKLELMETGQPHLKTKSRHPEFFIPHYARRPTFARGSAATDARDKQVY